MADLKIKVFDKKRHRILYGRPIVHYHLEKRKGAHLRGKLIDGAKDSYLVYTEKNKVLHHRLVLSKKRGIFRPKYISTGWFEEGRFVYNEAKACDSDVLPLDHSLFRGVKVLQTRVGFFNSDKRLDVSYVVKDPVKGLMTYFFYTDDFQSCLGGRKEKTFRAIWATVQLALESYYKLAKKVPRSILRKFVKAAHLSHKLTSKHMHDRGALFGSGLELIIKMLLKQEKDKRQAISLVYAVLTAIEKGKWSIIKMYTDFAVTNMTWLRKKWVGKRFNERELLSLSKSLVALSRTLNADQIAVLNFLRKHNKVRKRGAAIIHGLAHLVKNHSGNALYVKVYKLFGGVRGLSAKQVEGYGKIIRYEARIRAKDLRAAKRALGSAKAYILWKKFKIARFGRYHESILKQMVPLALNPQHDRKKPLIFIATARNDASGAFYWGKNFKHDKRVRIIIVEANDYGQFKRMSWSVRKEYGIPDSMLITAHGDSQKVYLGSKTRAFGGVEEVNPQGIGLKDYGRLKRDFKGFFGKKRGYIVLNACSVGARRKGNAMNPAQMFANAFNAEVRAARNVEGLLDVTLQFNADGRAVLHPTFFETQWPYFGFNHGGSIFLPNKTGKVPERVYNGAADANTGWRFGGGLSLLGKDLSLDVLMGYSHAFWHRLRLRADLGIHYHPITSNVSASFDPEAAVGITNNLLIFGGGRFGVTMNGGSKAKPLYQANLGVKILIRALNGEIDFGAASRDGKKLKFFFKFQSRF